MLGERKGLRNGFVTGAAQQELVWCGSRVQDVDGGWASALLPNHYIVIVGGGHPEPTLSFSASPVSRLTMALRGQAVKRASEHITSEHAPTTNAASIWAQERTLRFGTLPSLIHPVSYPCKSRRTGKRRRGERMNRTVLGSCSSRCSSQRLRAAVTLFDALVRDEIVTTYRTLGTVSED
jgi:hypothetical protein